MNNDELKFTGERMHNHSGSDIYELHMIRYKFVADYVKNKKVLDLACGSGYGTSFLAKYASSVTGADIDAKTIQYCKAKYKNKNVSFLQIHPSDFDPRLQKKFDIVISLETVEHAKNGKKFIDNLIRYLKPNGTLILSTPNNFEKNHPPENKFHIYEYDILELFKILKRKMPSRSINIFGQYKTGIMRKDNVKISLKKKFIKKIYKAIYKFDLYHVGLLKHIEHTKLYKKIGGLQHDQKRDFSIYKINPLENFNNPADSIYVCMHTMLR